MKVSKKCIVPLPDSRYKSVSGNRLFINGRELQIAVPKMKDLLDQVVYPNLISK